MITINPDYDIILTYSPIAEITGHIFECFDYWLILKTKYKVGILFLVGLSKDQLQIAWESKYNVAFSEVESSIIIIDDKQFSGTHIYKFARHQVVILCDGNIRALNDRKIIFSTDKMIGFLCGDHHFEQCQLNKNIIYLQDERIYGKNRFFKSYDYVKKLPFKYYKKSQRTFDNTGMMYVTFACRKITPEVIKEYYERSGCEKIILIVPYKLAEYDNIDGIQQIVAPVENFFDKFDIYIYTPVQRKFDCSPRLVTECFMQNKQILIDLPYVDVGLQTRYNDCKKDINKLNLTMNDDIFCILKKEWQM